MRHSQNIGLRTGLHSVTRERTLPCSKGEAAHGSNCLVHSSRGTGTVSRAELRAPKARLERRGGDLACPSEPENYHTAARPTGHSGTTSS